MCHLFLPCSFVKKIIFFKLKSPFFQSTFKEMNLCRSVGGRKENEYECVFSVRVPSAVIGPFKALLYREVSDPSKAQSWI